MEEKKSKIGLAVYYWPMAVMVMLIASFWIGRLTVTVEQLKNGSVAGANAVAVTPTPEPTPAPVTMDQMKGLFDQDLVKFGDANSKVLFVQVFDPSCPYCGAASGQNGALGKQMGAQFTLKADGGSYVSPVVEMRKLVDEGKASLVWLYSNGHGAGEMGTKALYCAYEKGKFWQAEDLLMSAAGYDLVNNKVRNDKAQSGALAQFLRKVVDADFMKSCLDSGKYDARLASDAALAASLGTRGTPAFIVNTTRFAGAYSYEQMKGVVEAALAQ